MDTGCFHVLAIVNTAMNIEESYLFELVFSSLSFFFFLDIYPEVELLGLMVVLFLVFENPLCYFPQWLHQFTFPPTMYKGSASSMSSPTFVIHGLSYDSLPNRCEVISHCGFNLYFFHDKWRWRSFHVPVGHLCVFFLSYFLTCLCVCSWCECLCKGELVADTGLLFTKVAFSWIFSKLWLFTYHYLIFCHIFLLPALLFTHGIIFLWIDCPSPTWLLLLLLLSRFSPVWLCATPQTAAHQAPPFLGFSRQEHWSGLPFPSPMRESEVTQSCPTLSDPMDCSPPGSSVHGIFQARVLEWVAVPSPVLHYTYKITSVLLKLYLLLFVIIQLYLIIYVKTNTKLLRQQRFT